MNNLPKRNVLNNSPATRVKNRVNYRIAAFALLVSVISLSGCVTEQTRYLADFHWAFFTIAAIMAGMAIFGYIFSRRQYKEDKAEEKEIRRETGTGTPTR